MDMSMSIVAGKHHEGVYRYLVSDCLGFPLQSLDLSDYCHITDVGIKHIAAMGSLSVLLLSRTKLTDDGMPFLAGNDNVYNVFEHNILWHVCTCPHYTAGEVVHLVALMNV